jgi:hypothetical protein
MNFPIRGFNECLITYILAASADRYPVSADVYHRGWAQSDFFKNGIPIMATNYHWAFLTAGRYSSRNIHFWV